MNASVERQARAELLVDVDAATAGGARSAARGNGRSLLAAAVAASERQGREPSEPRRSPHGAFIGLHGAALRSARHDLDGGLDRDAHDPLLAIDPAEGVEARALLLLQSRARLGHAEQLLAHGRHVVRRWQLALGKAMRRAQLPHPRAQDEVRREAEADGDHGGDEQRAKNQPARQPSLWRRTSGVPRLVRIDCVASRAHRLSYSSARAKVGS